VVFRIWRPLPKDEDLDECWLLHIALFAHVILIWLLLFALSPCTVSKSAFDEVNVDIQVLERVQSFKVSTSLNPCLCNFKIRIGFAFMVVKQTLKLVTRKKKKRTWKLVFGSFADNNCGPHCYIWFRLVSKYELKFFSH
jgi:hypothetical protein